MQDPAHHPAHDFTPGSGLPRHLHYTLAVLVAGPVTFFPGDRTWRQEQLLESDLDVTLWPVVCGREAMQELYAAGLVVPLPPWRGRRRAGLGPRGHAHAATLAEAQLAGIRAFLAAQHAAALAALPRPERPR